MVPCSKGTSPPRGRPRPVHRAWHSHAGLARAPRRKQEPFVPPGQGAETRSQQRALVGVPGGDPALGSVPKAPSQAVLGAACPCSPVQDADTPLLPLQIYPDPELEAQVLSLAIRCIHSEEGCRWSGLIKHLQVGPGRIGRGAKCVPHGLPHHHPCAPQAHLGTCSFNVIPCPNRCSAKLSRRDLPDHIQHGCPKRRVKCEFCASDFTGEAFEVGTGGGHLGDTAGQGAMVAAMLGVLWGVAGMCGHPSGLQSIMGTLSRYGDRAGMGARWEVHRGGDSLGGMCTCGLLVVVPSGCGGIVCPHPC